MIDAHAHLTFEAFDQDREEIIKRAYDAGVEKIITVGTQVSSSIDALELAKRYEGMYATAGVHPHHADKIAQDWIKQLENIASDPKVVAIGECGLDNYHYHSNGVVDMKIQIEVFEAQIRLAHRLSLPLQIHNRLAWKEIEDVISGNKKFLQDPPGLLHCFSGPREYLKKMLDLGFYIGFDGNITYKNIARGETVHLQDLLAATPPERIITETDCPYLSPVPHRGTRNEPKNGIITAQFIADKKKISLQELITQVEQNTHKLFKI